MTKLPKKMQTGTTCRALRRLDQDSGTIGSSELDVDIPKLRYIVIENVISREFSVNDCGRSPTC